MSTQTHVHLIGDAIQPSHPLLSPSPPAFYLLSIRVFSNESVRIRCPKDWSFSFSISSSNEYSGLTLFRKDWLALLAVKETLKSLLHHHSSKYQFFRAQLSLWSKSHIHIWLLETTALTRWTFVGKIMSLLFNMLSLLIITFLPKNKCLLISWLQSPSAMILDTPKLKSLTVSIVSPSICLEEMELMSWS